MKNLALGYLVFLLLPAVGFADVPKKKEVVSCVDSANRPYHLVFETTKFQGKIAVGVTFTSHSSHLFGSDLGPWAADIVHLSFKDEADYGKLFRGDFWQTESMDKMGDIDTLVANPDAHYFNLSGSAHYAEGSRGFIRVYILGTTGKFSSIGTNFVDDQIIELSGCVWNLLE